MLPWAPRSVHRPVGATYLRPPEATLLLPLAPLTAVLTAADNAGGAVLVVAGVFTAGGDRGR